MSDEEELVVVGGGIVIIPLIWIFIMSGNLVCGLIGGVLSYWLGSTFRWQFIKYGGLLITMFTLYFMLLPT